MTPSDLTSPPCSATATAIVSAWTSKPTNFNLVIDRLLSLVALYCWSSDSQHNPRPRIGVGHSILTNAIRPKSVGVVLLHHKLLNLLVSQCDHRVHFRGAASWNIAR